MSPKTPAKAAPRGSGAPPILPEEKEILKQLARLGGLHDFVYTSSGELAGRIGVSQQTASRKILELLDRGLIVRRMGTRKQLIRLAPAGVAVLRSEFAEYASLFHGGERVVVRGRVATGLGEGRYYLSRDGYRSQFRKLLGFDPYPGTLNVEVDTLDREKLAELKEVDGLLATEFMDEGRTFGAVKCFRARVKARAAEADEAAVVLPVRSHHTNVLEVIAPVSLRESLRLADGTEVSVTVEFGTKA